jgi:hypothetical protein
VNSSDLQVAIALAQAIALLMSVAFISYALVIVVPYLRYKPSPAGDARTLDWHLFAPALNEEQVIGGTIDYLRATSPGPRVGDRRRQRGRDRVDRGHPGLGRSHGAPGPPPPPARPDR